MRDLGERFWQWTRSVPWPVLVLALLFGIAAVAAVPVALGYWLIGLALGALW